MKQKFYYYRYYIKDIICHISSDIKWCVYILILAAVWIENAARLYKHIPNEISEWMNKAYNFINNNLWLNILICIFLIEFCFKLCDIIKNLQFYRFNWFLVIALVYLLLYYESPFEYATIAFGVDYRHFLSVLLFAILISMVIGIIINREKSKSNELLKGLNSYDDNLSGFSTDLNKNFELPVSVNDYAQTIVDKLLVTDLCKESFAIGITSKWGSGKTTFLHLLKDKIVTNNNMIDIIEFNPWMCQSPEQVTKDFFSSLRHQLAKKHPELSVPIKKYARLLGSITLHLSGYTSIKLKNFAFEKSLLEMKKQLSDKFSRLKDPIVVIIDDLDRLDSSEVFEVLRLIRNTADLHNMIYLVAYDKNYITKILENQHISDPAAYLEKIFQLEIQLPVVTNEQVLDTFLSELHSQLPKGTDFSFINEHKELIVDILKTYRRAKRFARLFSLSYDYLIGNRPKHKLILKEKLLLDLLQMDDKDIYDILWEKPEKLLEKTDKQLWVYEKGMDNGKIIKEKGITKTKDGIHIKPTTDKLLTCLWGENVNEPERYSVRRVESYSEFFTLKAQISKEDFEELINSKDVDILVKGWAENRFSIFYYIDQETLYNINELQEKKKKNIVWGILSYYFYNFGGDNMVLSTAESNLLKLNTKFISQWFCMKMKDGNCNYFALVTIIKSLVYEIDNKLLIEQLYNVINYIIHKRNCSILDILFPIDDSLEWLKERKIGFKRILLLSIKDYISKNKPNFTLDKFEKAHEKFEKTHPLYYLYSDLSSIYEVLQKYKETNQISIKDNNHNKFSSPAVLPHTEITEEKSSDLES